jgi:hypothetical protein
MRGASSLFSKKFGIAMVIRIGEKDIHPWSPLPAPNPLPAPSPLPAKSPLPAHL